MPEPVPSESNPSAQESLRRTVVEAEKEPMDSRSPWLFPAARQSRDRIARGAEEPEVARCRPAQRPPVAVLQILDDSMKTVETVRIRKAPFVIGRNEGDFLVPHDPLISHRHAEITRTLVGDKWQWELRDLESRNGTFVQVKECLLEPGTEILLARLRFRFTPATKSEAAATVDIRQTQVWTAGSAPGHEPEAHLVEWKPEGEGRKIPLCGGEQWIGRDPRQSSIFLEDVAVNPSHARVFKDPLGQWRITDDDTINGTWLRVNSVALMSGAAFLLGEQVFFIVFP